MWQFIFLWRKPGKEKNCIIVLPQYEAGKEVFITSIVSVILITAVWLLVPTAITRRSGRHTLCQTAVHFSFFVFHQNKNQKILCLTVLIAQAHAPTKRALKISGSVRLLQLQILICRLILLMSL